MESVKVKLKDLTPDPKNTRMHDSRNISVVKKSLEKFGQYRPFVIQKKGMVIRVGNGMYQAMHEMGLKEGYANILDLTDEEADTLSILDNRSSELAEWDDALLLGVLDDLPNDLFELTGFSQTELDEIIDSIEPPKQIVEDEAPEPPEVPKTELGRMYQLGKHRLMCGDSTSEKDVATLLNKNKIDMVFTDPPYGMNAVSKSGVLSKNYTGDILGDDNNEVALDSFQLCSSLEIEKQVWWGANYYSSILPNAECWLVWDKNNGGSDQTDCELAWTNFRSVVRQHTQASEKTHRVHPTQKPVSLIVWVFNKFTAGDMILDLFGGSGSTLIACEQTSRQCRMMELDPKYCDVIVQRYCNLMEIDSEKVFETGVAE